MRNQVLLRLRLLVLGLLVLRLLALRLLVLRLLVLRLLVLRLLVLRLLVLRLLVLRLLYDGRLYLGLSNGVSTRHRELHSAVAIDSLSSEGTRRGILFVTLTAGKPNLCCRHGIHLDGCVESYRITRTSTTGWPWWRRRGWRKFTGYRCQLWRSRWRSATPFWWPRNLAVRRLA